MPPTKKAAGRHPKRALTSSLPVPNPNPNPDIKPNKPIHGGDANYTKPQFAPGAAVSPPYRNKGLKSDIGVVGENCVIENKDRILSTEKEKERVGEGNETLAPVGIAECENKNANGEEEGTVKKKKKVRKVVKIVKRIVKKRVPKLVRKSDAVSVPNDGSSEKGDGVDDCNEGLEDGGLNGEMRISGGDDGGRKVGKVDSLVSDGVENEGCDIGVEVAGEEGGKRDVLVGVLEEVGDLGMIDIPEVGEPGSSSGFLVDAGMGDGGIVEKFVSVAEMPVDELNANPAVGRSVDSVSCTEMSDVVNGSVTIEVPMEEVNGDAVGRLLAEAVNSDPNTETAVQGVEGSNVTEMLVEMVSGDTSTVTMPEETVNDDTASEVEAVDVDLVGDRSDECKAKVAGASSGEKERGKEVEKGGDGGTAVGGILVSGELEALERRRRRKTEIFIGGLSKDAKEEDIRKVFEQVGEVVEVRLAHNGKTGKSKGFAFVKYASADDAKKALEKLREAEICGKKCAAAPVEGNDTIFLGNIDKKWKNEDVTKLLQEIGIEKIDKVTVMVDPNNVECNRGFAFLELETNKHAQIAFKKLQNVSTGKLQKVKVAWAEPLSEPDEEELLKVKSVYAEYLPSSWDENKVREHFRKFGEIENVVLARNLHSSKRKDFAFINFSTREEALACIESLKNGMLSDEGLKVHVKVSLAKPVPKGKAPKKVLKSTPKQSYKQNPMGSNRPVKVLEPRNKGIPAAYINDRTGNARSFETTSELERQLAERALQKQIQGRLGFVNPDYSSALSERKRSFSMLGHDVYHSDPRHYSHMRVESSFPVGRLSHHKVPSSVAMTSPYYHQQGVGYASGSEYADFTNTVKSEELPYRGSGNLHFRY